ncbi:hypothetical protein N7495_008632 [Penicillium taxi]|uniref:uncharacterized protein n=1 Tax=Penicillium taxi TaxID=168475 RepID=UPI0025451368|nr:uncharacterized protein N7495_008632 [Penicillium taxi]KAJ5888591.1 hypothetical protein N7495_008632 [Penicillium taxi]
MYRLVQLAIYEEHKEVLDSTGMLATVYWLGGRWREVEQLDMQVMETRKTKLSEIHPDTLMSMASLAATYMKQGRLGDAEQLQMQVIETSRRNSATTILTHC